MFTNGAEWNHRDVKPELKGMFSRNEQMARGDFILQLISASVLEKALEVSPETIAKLVCVNLHLGQEWSRHIFAHGGDYRSD